METTNKSGKSEVDVDFRSNYSTDMKKGQYTATMEADILVSKSDKSIEEQLEIIKTLRVYDLRGATRESSSLNEHFGYKYDPSGDK